MALSVKPKTYTQEIHKIETDQIDHHALFILDRLRAEGHEAYLVGGSVRDLLLGETPKDFDISTSASPEEVKKLFRNCLLIGRRFRLAHVRFGKKIIEVSTFRAGDPESDDLIVRDNVFGTAEEDVKRRDFTINGLFYDSESECIIDYVDGYPDAAKRYLRVIGQPYVRFKQDPVRMIRLLKFKARFGLDIDPDAHQALLECRSEIVKSASARILEELLRMLESGSSAPFFKLMADHGILEHILPLLSDFLETPEGNEVISYLEELDRSIKEPHNPHLDRPVLLACLIFPLYEQRIKTRYIDREKSPHLGVLFEEGLDLMDDLFNPFFRFPRRLKGQVGSILSNQYRMTPLSPEKNRRIRVPNFPEFPYAVQFFGLRASLHVELIPIKEKWESALEARGITGPVPQKRPRKRRRRRGPPKSQDA